MIEKIRKTEDEWKKILTPEQYYVMRGGGTETAFSCAWKEHGDGAYHCSACGLALFSSKSKFESGSGWPSYFEPIEAEHISEQKDDSLGMSRIEVSCTRCGSHLGHVFDDGPAPTKKRFCINSISLIFKQKTDE